MNDEHAFDAEDYSQQSESPYQAVQGVLERIEWTLGADVLDVGCGAGALAADMAHRVPAGSVLGIDAAADCIDLAVGRYTHIPNLAFAECPVQQLSDQAAYDIITSFSALHWCGPQAEVLQILHSALRPSGQLWAVIFPKCSPDWDPLLTVLAQPEFSAYNTPDSASQHWLTVADYEVCCAAVGFSEVSAEVSMETAEYADIDAYFAAVKAWLPRLVNLPAEQVDPFLLALGRVILERYGQADDMLSIPYKQLVLSARKV